MAVPSEFKYSKEHEWVKIEDNVATIGITEYAQNELGDIVFVELPETNDEMNEELENAPSQNSVVKITLIRKAWMVKVEMNDESQLDALLSADQYSEMIGE